MSDKPKNPSSPSPPAADRDAMDKLSLSTMPLASTTLKSAKLVKNAQLETMVELHSDKDTGSLQIRPADIPASFPATSKQDLALIEGLAALKSYDVFSLRSSLAKLGIEMDKSQLELSDETKARLERNSMEFIRPLVINLFGDGTEAPDSTSLAKLLRDPDIARVQQRLKIMSQKTGIPVEGIPAFLQTYRDMFLSTSYYRDSFDAIAPDLNRFWLWLAELKSPRSGASAAALAACGRVTVIVRNLFTSTRDRQNKFRASFESFWRDMNPESFQRLRQQIEDNHSSMGAVLCGLGVKMRSWSAAFPDNNTGSPAARTAYVTSELEPGLDALMTIENDARFRLGMPKMTQ
ncbi:MAG: hypothetical protein EPN97_11680 [Alphaproteobacteria bacterium]|nr:MAG: hypothetical protein EPN97_11680 [Alphaproteobacteria bacterium]